jgi:hypothetical protein
MHDFKQLDDQYYSARTRIVDLENGKFRAHGRIHRNDTQEAVQSAMSVGVDEAEAMSALFNDLSLKKAALPKQPYEWGMVARRDLVQKYAEYNDGLTRIARDIEAERASQNLSEEVPREKLRAITSYVERNMVSLLLLVRGLTDEDRQVISATSPALYDQADCPLHADEICARLDIAERFLKQ